MSLTVNLLIVNYLPMSTKFSFILIMLLIFNSNCIISQIIPTTFDLRNANGSNFVTTVKMQQGGTCWTHGALASIEGNMMITNAWTQSGEQGEPALAEYHLDWWNGFNQHNNDDFVSVTGNGLVVHNGGDYRVTAAYLSRGEGAVREIDAPNFNTAPLRFDSNYHYFYPRIIEWYNIGLNLERINTVKKTVMNQGVVGTCMCVGFWENGNIHYQPQNSTIEPNHAVAIVGWNDTIHTSAPGLGAWLVKNSWGTSWGDAGYFWISYYDKHCGQEPQMGAVSFQEVEPMQYNHIFYHDYHGWRDELSNCNEAFNVFVNSSDFKSMEAISFYNAADSVNFTAIVFGEYSNGILKDTLSFLNGFINHAGFHTFNLDSAVALLPGDSFFLYLSLSNGGQPYDRSSEVPVLLGASAVSGPIIISKSDFYESFYKINGGNWLDLHTFDTTANFCMKALTNPLLPLTAESPKGDYHICNSAKTSTYTIPSTKYTTSYNWALTPSNAGVLTSTDTVAEIKWASGFSGSANLTVTPINSHGAGNQGIASINYYNTPQVKIGNDTSILEHHTISFEVNQGFIQYLWNDSSTNFSTTFSGLSLGVGIHPIWVQITDSNLCRNSDTLLLEVKTDASIFNKQFNKLTVYPNPVKDEINFNLQILELSEVEIILTNALGQSVFKQNMIINTSQDKYRIQLPSLPSGNYQLQIKNKDIKLTEKIIIHQN
jgi:C1A family cysteine protease